MLERINCGGAEARLRIAADRTMDVRFSGLLTQRNLRALSSLVLAAGVDRGAGGVLCSLERGLLTMPAVDPLYYSLLSPLQRRLPVAVLVSTAQYPVYERVAQAAAASGTIRRVFLSREPAECWLREQTRALRANRTWWAGQRRAHA